MTGTGIDIEAIAAQAATINTHFLGLDLSVVPHYCIGMDPSYSTVQLSFYCFTLCMPESGERVAERAGRFGTMGSNNFTVAFSTYFTFLVPGGVGLYWIFSNLFSTALIYILNAVYNPKNILITRRWRKVNVCLQNRKR